MLVVDEVHEPVLYLPDKRATAPLLLDALPGGARAVDELAEQVVLVARLADGVVVAAAAGQRSNVLCKLGAAP